MIYLHTYMLRNWPGTVGPTFLSPGGLLRLWQEVRKADVVHINGTRNIFALASALFAYWQQKHFVLQPHGTLPRIVSSIFMKRIFDKLFMHLMIRNANALIALQSSEAQQIVDAGGDIDHTRIVSNGLNTTAYDVENYHGHFRKRYGISPECQIVLFLGRINRKKGTDLLVRAYSCLPEPILSTIKLVIAGPDDGQLAEVQDLVEQYQLQDKVLFTGVLTGDEVLAAHADANLFVLPCRVDTFPMVILEACQANTPMVVTETCEIADILKDKAATIVPVDSASIAQAMAEILQDVNLSQCYQRGAKELMLTVFSIKAVGQKLEEIYIQAKESV